MKVFASPLFFVVFLVAFMGCEQDTEITTIPVPVSVVEESDCFEFNPVTAYGKVSYEETDEYLNDRDLLTKVAFEIIDDGVIKRKIYVHLINPKDIRSIWAVDRTISIELMGWLDIGVYSGRIIGVPDIIRW